MALEMYKTSASMEWELLLLNYLFPGRGWSQSKHKSILCNEGLPGLGSWPARPGSAYVFISCLTFLGITILKECQELNRAINTGLRSSKSVCSIKADPSLPLVIIIRKVCKEEPARCDNPNHLFAYLVPRTNSHSLCKYKRRSLAHTEGPLNRSKVSYELTVTSLKLWHSDICSIWKHLSCKLPKDALMSDSKVKYCRKQISEILKTMYPLHKTPLT